MNMQNRKMFIMVHCVLNPAVRATRIPGREEELSIETDVYTKLIDILTVHDIGMIQLPCPELEFFGYPREVAQKDRIDKKAYRRFCNTKAKETRDMIKAMLKKTKGLKILGIIGFDPSPTCGVYEVSKRRVKGRSLCTREKGIFTEELERVLKRSRLRIPFLTITSYSKLRDKYL